jgi:hypothetical protein
MASSVRSPTLHDSPSFTHRMWFSGSYHSSLMRATATKLVTKVAFGQRSRTCMMLPVVAIVV